MSNVKVQKLCLLNLCFPKNLPYRAMWLFFASALPIHYDVYHSINSVNLALLIKDIDVYRHYI